MRRVVAVVGLVACALAGCRDGGGRAPAVDRSSPSATGFPFTDTTNIGNADRLSQRFCAVPPTAGLVRYEAAGNTARLIVRLRRVRLDGLVGVTWIPGGGHEGEVIASVRVEDGATAERTLRFFHAPYYSQPASGVLLTTNSGSVVARTRPCRPQPRRLYAGCHRQAFGDAHAHWVSPETGENAFIVDLTLVGPGPCSLQGYPTVELRDRRGRALPFVYTPGVGQYITHAPPRWVNLRPGQHVYAEIAKYRCDTTSYRRATKATVAIGLATVKVAIPPNSNLTYCGAHDPGSQVEISRLTRREMDLYRR